MIKTRFSPSPTGLIHLGNARAALFSALFAKKSQGTFLLRIEDTDASRSEHYFVEKLEDDLKWLGIEWQEGADVGGEHGPYFQSQRRDIYAKYYQQLEDLGRAYPCFCSEQELALQRKLQLSRGQAPRYSGKCRQLSQEDVKQRILAGEKPALRFHVPDDELIEFVDLVKGPQKFSSFDIGDFIIRRADGSSSFMFCNAIDDSLMGVTHVIRGEDHLTNTPRQLMILRTLKMRHADYGHLSLIISEDGGKLSKREGSSNLNDLRELGYLPQAVLNYMARLSHAYEKLELMTFDELAEHFHLEKLSRAPARFDHNQLMHWQKETVMRLSLDDVWVWLGDELKQRVPEKSRDIFADVMRKNIELPNEAKRWAEIFFGDELIFQPEHTQILEMAGAHFFEEAVKISVQCGEDLKHCINELKTKLNVSGKQLFMPVRIALTGEQQGPEMPQIAVLLGAEKIRQRFEKAFELTRGK